MACGLTAGRLARLAVLATALCAANPIVAQERRGGAPGDFDFYVLALSWSPGFCASGGEGRGQCRDGAGLGFVVHGLWPQFDRGFPSDCQPANPSPPRMALDTARGLFPDEGLARYEWRKHGTCSGKSPADYFRDVRAARDAVTIPPALEAPSSPQSTTALELERAFVAANPGLRVDMMSVACRGNVLQEVRICFTRDLRGFTSCREVDQRGCRSRDITIPPVR